MPWLFRCLVVVRRVARSIRLPDPGLFWLFILFLIWIFVGPFFKTPPTTRWL